MTKFYYPALFAAFVLIHSVVSARSETMFSNVALQAADGRISTTVTWPRKSAQGPTVSLDLRVATDAARLRSDGGRLAFAFPFTSR
jgi:hypothetical protein